MAPIDLPPEPPLNQQIVFSRSAADLQIVDQGNQSLLTGHHPSPHQAINLASGPSFSPISLIPSRQLSVLTSDDFSMPNLAELAQLPPLPDQATPTATPPAIIDENTLDTINDEVDEVLDSDTTVPEHLVPEHVIPESIDTEDIEPSLDLDNVDSTAIDAEKIESQAGDLDVINDVINPVRSEPGTLDPLPAESHLEETVDSGTPESIEETLETAPVSPPAAEDTATPLDPAKLEITADTQTFNSNRQVVTARGNVVFKLNNAFLLADELWVNLVNRYVLAEGNVILTRGEQEVRGERAEYSLLQEEGTLFETRGELFLPGLANDFSSPLEGSLTSRSVFDPLNPDQSINNVTSAGGLQINSSISGATPGSLPETRGGVRRLRFEAARVNFDSESWVAEEVRLTNDPFSPPELEFRTDRMTLVTLSPTADLLTTEDPKLVFDQAFSLPILKSRYVLNRGAVDPNQVNPFLVSISSDSRDRGGVFLESEFPLVRNESVNFSITPQYFVERALEQGALASEVFGLEADFKSLISPRSEISASATLTSFNFNELEDNLRGNIRNRYRLGNHLLVSEYTYRDRLFNGSLGFQDVRSSLGSVLLSPVINLDGRGLNLTYQVGGQLVTAKTDRTDLLNGPLGGDDLTTLGRFQGSARLSKGFNLWLGKPLPATQTEGLRYTPVPIVPFLNLTVGLFGVGSYYTNGDFQEVIAGDIRFDGQIGHLSKNFFDYTRFNLGYYQELISGNNSPFLFDRNVDDSILTFGVLQQIVGPILLGFQTSINIETGEDINTEIIGEYSRRTYGLVVRYSPTQETGSIGFRLSDFNWLGSGSPFDNRNTRQVEGGVLEQR
ncbi:DUF3769 domain-containing protein [Leptothoe spongobia TAU-MAC 1115]|uniref:DUF3769 domain-containing protein n=2 Tax=Leptothoe TaxID=2651725 RepID=A0A947DBW8_9CYAN|nr:DUF3769 domain-containing protein [Leptothoe spongobia TAU-MAC 1115]